MRKEDIKVGMKVKLLGKHAFGDSYDNIEDFYKKITSYSEVQKIKEQGYGIVVGFNVENRWVLMSDELENDCVWYFLPSDIEPYEEEIVQTIQEKTPKEWLMTPLAVFTTRSGEECITLGDKFGYTINSGISLVCVDADYDEDLNDIVNEPLHYDVMKITYHNKVVWQRKEEYFTLVEAIKFNKEVKHKDWDKFYRVNDVLINLAKEQNDFIIEALSEKVWEVR